MVIAVGLLLTTCAEPDAPAAAPPSTVVESNATLVRVVDGDTVVVDIDGQRETVRLIGIDTPETVKPNSPVECFGPEASARTKALLATGTSVVVQRDREARDRYGRLLRYVVKRSTGRDLNRVQVWAGWASVYVYGGNPFERVTSYRRAQREAQVAPRGIWKAC